MNHKHLVERSLDERPPGGRRGSVRRSVTVNVGESPIAWLHHRKLISDRQLAAGDQLRDDYEFASLGPSVTMRWDPAPLSRGRRGAPEALSPSERQQAAKGRFDAALQSVGPGLSDIVWRVVCAGEGLREAENALGWPVRAGKVVLGLALDRLADFYRLK